MELWKYYRILRKRKWLIIIGTLICVGGVVASILLSTQTYEAFTTVMESNPDQMDVNIFQSNSMSIDPKMRLANLSQMVKSQAVLNKTADRIKNEANLSVDPATILSTLEVVPLMDTSMLLIKVTSEDHTEAQITANYITSEFIKYYSDLNFGGPTKTKIFLEDELPRAKADLDSIRDEIRKYKEENGAVSLNNQTGVMFQEMAQIKTAASQNAVAARAAQAKLDSLKQQMNEFPETRTASTVIASNPLYQSLQVDLAKQEIQLQGMLKTRTAEHKEVKALQKQIDETQAKLRETATTIMNSSTEVSDPIRDRLVEAYAMAYVEQTAADAASSAAEQVLSSLQPELDTLPEKEMRLAQLNLEEQVAQNTYTLLGQKLEEAKIKEKEANTNGRIKVIDEAQVRETDDKKVLKIILSLILAPIFCSGIAMLLNYLDNTVRTPAEAEELLKLPVSAVVPIAKGHSLAAGKSNPAIDTSYQMLSTNLLIGHHDLKDATILIASAEPDVGRSVTAANLAITMARDGARVILVDSDLRQPSTHTVFGIKNDKGLSNVLAGQLSIENALQPTKVKDLLLITSGPLPSNPVRLLRSEEMAKFVNTIKELADFVIFDSPAGITFPDSALLAALVKNVVIVHAAGVVSRGAEDEFRARLDQVDANLIGVVLNMVRPEDSHGYYHFRSAYEELMRASKGQFAPAKALSGLGKDGEDTDKGQD